MPASAKVFTRTLNMFDWGVEISGTGGYLPGTKISNQELIDRYELDTTDEWIRENLGIYHRHWAPESVNTSDIAYQAGKEALDNAGIAASQLDRIILCTSTGDYLSPATGPIVQHLLGAECPAEDKSNACAGFIFGLDHGARLIATGLHHVLVIGADIKSRFVAKNDYRFLPIFGDGAGAFVLSRANIGNSSANSTASANSQSEPTLPKSGLLECELWTDGSKARDLYTPAGGSAMAASLQTVNDDLHTLKLGVAGQDIVKDATAIMTKMANKVCAQQGVNPSDVDVFVPHQANFTIIKKVAKALNISSEKVVVTIDFAANTVAGTLPFSFHHALTEGRLRSGMLVLMVTVGAGFSAGAALYRMP